jgi:DMSO/TMAO reductase YedYZ molybdopterin-dependent catalytic subunit
LRQKFYVHNRFVMLIITISLLFVAVTTMACGTSAENAYKDIDWQLTLVGDEEIVLDFDEILAMSSYSGRSGFFTSVGIVNGPFDIKGVPLLDLCDLVGGVGPSEYVRVSAVDNYSMVFSYNQLHGEFITYNTSLHEVENDGLILVLMYEMDGAPLTEDVGRPLRIAIIGDNVLTEGMYWVKWINKVEILNFD